MGSQRIARRLAALGATALLGLALSGTALAAPGDDGSQPAETLEASAPEILSVTYYDESGKPVKKVRPGGPGGRDDCMGAPAGGQISPSCGGPPRGCGEVEARHGFSRFFGTIWLYHRVYWCWGDWVVTTAYIKRHWRVIGAGVCNAGDPSSWHSGGGIGRSYVSFRSQVDATCIGYAHMTIWMDIGYSGTGGYWAIAWSEH